MKFALGLLFAVAALAQPLTLWYQEPAKLWTDALPVGNGRLGAMVYVGAYPVRDPALAAPVRLSFTGVKAEVAGRCGEWPDDLASGASLDGWQNRAFWNFGCANQATLSAQIADPRDLLSPRGETPQDIETRMRAINKVRAGSDPSTGWVTKSGAISGVGG